MVAYSLCMSSQFNFFKREVFIFRYSLLPSIFNADSIIPMHPQSVHQNNGLVMPNHKGPPLRSDKTSCGQPTTTSTKSKKQLSSCYCNALVPQDKIDLTESSIGWWVSLEVPIHPSTAMILSKRFFLQPPISSPSMWLNQQISRIMTYYYYYFLVKLKIH